MNATPSLVASAFPRPNEAPPPLNDPPSGESTRPENTVADALSHAMETQAHYDYGLKDKVFRLVNEQWGSISLRRGSYPRSTSLRPSSSGGSPGRWARLHRFGPAHARPHGLGTCTVARSRCDGGRTPFSVDAFSSGLSAHLPRFWSRFDDKRAEWCNLSASWSLENAFAFPDPNLVGDVISRIKMDGARGTLIALQWPSAPWFPLLYATGRKAPSPRRGEGVPSPHLFTIHICGLPLRL